MFSVIPVIGVIPDLATLAISDNRFEQALSVIGIIASLGDLLALVPGLQAVGGGSAVADGLAGGFKVVYKLAASGVTRDVLKNLASFELAFNLATGLIEATGKLFLKELREIASSPQAMLTFLRGTWTHFDGLVQLLRAQGLREVGVTTGGLLLGRLASTGKTFSEGVVKPLIRVFDRIAGTPLAKNDEALGDVADIVEAVGEPSTLRLLEGTSCLVEAVTGAAPRSPVIALFAPTVAYAESADDPCALIVKSGRTLSQVLGKERCAEVIDTLSSAVSGTEKEQIFLIIQKMDTTAIKNLTTKAIWPHPGIEILQRYPSPTHLAVIGKAFGGYTDNTSTIMQNARTLADRILAIPTDRMLYLLDQFRDARQERIRDGIAAYTHGIFNIKPSYKGVGFGAVEEFISNVAGRQEKSVLMEYAQMEGVTLLGIGDPGTKRALGMPGDSKAVDVLAIRDGRFILSDSKGTLGILNADKNINHYIEQMESTVTNIRRVFTEGEPQFERIEIAVTKVVSGDTFRYFEQNGILMDRVTGDRVRIPGIEDLPVYIRVVSP